MPYRYSIVVQRDVFAGETLAVSIYVENFKGSRHPFNPFPIDVTLNVIDGQSGQNLISAVNRKLTRRRCKTIFVEVETNLEYDVARNCFQASGIDFPGNAWG